MNPKERFLAFAKTPACEIILLFLILCFAFAIRYTNPYYLADLPVVPDSVEYTTTAFNLYHLNGFHININQALASVRQSRTLPNAGKYPSRYPYGYALLLVPFYWLFGPVLHKAIYASLFFSLLSILLVYFLTRKVFGKSVALISALLLSVSPIHILLSEMVLCDIAALALIVLIMFLTYNLLVAPRFILGNASTPSHKFMWFLMGILIGFTASVHLLSIVVLIPVLVGIVGNRYICSLHQTNYRERRTIGNLIFLFVGLILSLLPLFIYNKMTFGGILNNGYSYWQPGIYDTFSKCFSLKYALFPVTHTLSFQGEPVSNLRYYTRALIGLGDFLQHGQLYQLPIFIFAIIGLVFQVVNFKLLTLNSKLFLWMALSLIVSFYLFLLVHTWQLVKFLLPVIPIVIIFASYGLISTLRVAAGFMPAYGKPIVSRILRILFGVVSFVLLLFIVKSTIPVLSQNSSAKRIPTWWFESSYALNKVTEPDAYIISGINGVYITHYVIAGTQRTYLPISRDVEYIKDKPDLPLIPAVDNVNLIDSLITSGKKVYIDGFTVRFWSEPCKVLAEHFAFKRIAAYYNRLLSIYQLTKK